MNRPGVIIIAAGALALAFFAGAGIGGAAVGPADTAIPAPTKTVTVHDPGTSVTVTPAPVVRVKEQTPQSCRDALSSADRLNQISAAYVDLSQQAVQAVINNDPTALDKVTAKITSLGEQVNRISPNYRADSAACRAVK